MRSNSDNAWLSDKTLAWKSIIIMLLFVYHNNYILTGGAPSKAKPWITNVKGIFDHVTVKSAFQLDVFIKKCTSVDPIAIASEIFPNTANVARMFNFRIRNSGNNSKNTTSIQMFSFIFGNRSCTTPFWRKKLDTSNIEKWRRKNTSYLTIRQQLTHASCLWAGAPLLLYCWGFNHLIL